MIIEFNRDVERIFGKKFSISFKVLSGTFDDFTVDIYPVENPEHPQRHIGYWVFEGLREGEDYTLFFDFETFKAESVLIEETKKKLSSHYWINENGFYEPVLDLQFVFRKGREIVKIVHSTLVLEGERRIEDFYTKESGGEYRIDALNLVFHNHRLNLLKKIFKKYTLDHYRVIDAGSGLSVFSLLKGNDWRGKVFAVDLKISSIKENRRIVYVNGNVEKLPFKSCCFDFGFSGEVIEHLYSPSKFLKEINRVLKMGSYFTLTTPNSDRLLNRLRGFKIPLSKEHINEMNVKELKRLLELTGFEVVKIKGIYLELFSTFFKKENHYDILQAKLNTDRFKPIMKILMKLGEFFPTYALDTVVVAKKVASLSN